MEGMSNALDKQKVLSYYDLYLNEETARYIFRIIAIKQVYNFPTRYGFFTFERDFYPPVSTRIIAVDTTVKDLPGFALNLKINYRILRELNPWLQSYTLPNKSGKIYSLKLPKDSTSILYENLMKKVPQRETFFHDTLKINSIH
jgi:membrane-bound lytic murein transglycosylase D